MPPSVEPPPLRSMESADALYSRVITRGRRLRRERRAFVLTAGMCLLLLAAAIPVALTNDDPAQLATTGPTTTRRPTTTTTADQGTLADPNASTTTSSETTAPVAVEGATATTARTTRTTARRSSTTARPPTTKQAGPAPTPAPSSTSTSTTVIPASQPASPCAGSEPVLVDHGLAFVRGGNVWMVPPTGGEPIQLTTTGDASKPAWSPDGTQLVFVRPGGLFKTTPAAGAPVTPVTATPGDTDPAWSPDGGRIAFVRGGDIFVMPANGSTAASRVRNEDAALGSPTWSPNSCDLAFTWKTWVLKARSDGTGVTGVGNGMREPSWASIDRLAVTAADGIRLVNPNGTGEVRLSGTSGGQVPSWRADGSAVAYRAGDGIRTVPASGGAPVPVPGTVAGDTDPAW